MLLLAYYAQNYASIIGTSLAATDYYWSLFHLLLANRIKYLTASGGAP